MRADFGSEVVQVRPDSTGRAWLCNLRPPWVRPFDDGEETRTVTAEVMPVDAPAESPPSVAPTDAGVGRFHLNIALVFLAVAALLAADVAVQLVLPELFTGVGFLSYGRLLPVATNLFLFGWLTIGLLGAIYFILPKVTGVDLEFAPLAKVSGAVLAVAYLAGSVAVGLGASEGRLYLELPLWADALAVLALLGAVRSITATISDRAGDTLTPVEWYFGSAPIWLLLTTVVGNIPGLIGVNSVIQTAFHRGALFGLWFAAAGVGVVYYLVPTLSGGEPRRPTRLTAIGFWSLGFVWALTGLSSLTYSAAPDWLESLGVLFSIVLFLPVMVIFADIVESMRGKWDRVGDRSALRLVMIGAVLFALIPFVNLVYALRSSNVVVGFTEWATGLEWVAAYGAFTFWLLAFVVHVAPSVRKGAIAPRAATVHRWGSLTGLALAAGSMLASGVLVGATWIANANGGIASASSGFRSSVERLEGWHWIRFVGVALFALSQVWFVVAYLRARSPVAAIAAGDVEEGGAAAQDGEDAEGISLDRLRIGTVGLFAVAAAFGLLFPTLEASHVTNTLVADESRYFDVDADLAAGRNLYLSEGCWYCHTQEVRQVVPDVGLGAVSQPGDYAWEVPAPRGTVRLGPDLFHVGSRDETATAQALLNHLFDPRAVRPWSTMPSYQHLSDDELTDLALYLANLE